jgi:hypothetical protein
VLRPAWGERNHALQQCGQLRGMIDGMNRVTDEVIGELREELDEKIR